MTVTNSHASELGYAFTLELCSAIEAVTHAEQAKDPLTSRYKQADLTYAIERILFISLVNNQELLHLFREQKLGKPLPKASVKTELERRVALQLCPVAAIGVSGSPAPFSARTLQSAGRRVVEQMLKKAFARPLRESAPTAQRLQSTRHPICFVVHHPKFVRFLLPILRHLEQDDVVFLATIPSVGTTLDGMGLTNVVMDNALMGWLNAKAIWSGAREWAYSADAYDRIERGLRTVAPRAVVVLEGNHPLDEITNQVCKSMGIPCRALQYGWSPIIHSGFRNMTYEQTLVWGEGFRKLLSPYNPGTSFAVTGSPIAEHAEPHKAASSLASKLNGRKAVTFFLQSPSMLITAEHLENFVKLAQAFAEESPDTPILLREHPSYSYEAAQRLETIYPNISLVPSESFSLRAVLDVSKLSVSVYSTTLVESAASLVPVVIYNPTSMPKYSPDIASFGAGIEVKDVASALAAIHRIMKDNAYYESFTPGLIRFREEFFAGNAATSARRIAEHITSV